MKPNGVGLGLSATHNIIQSLNGNIEVQSEIGKGTSFIIHFDHVANEPALEQGKLFA
jgi:C4-dicarboxylate-specific signal transduction histidine kinase